MAKLASADLVFVTQDHPAANGRTPQAGEQEFAVQWALENGTVLRVKMGRDSFALFRAWVHAMEYDDFIESVQEEP